MLRFVRRMWILAVPILAACGGPGSFQGTVQGVTLDVRSSAFTVDRATDGRINFIGLYLSDQPDACAVIKSVANVRNSVVLFIELTEWDANTNNITPTPGDYIVRDGSVRQHAIPQLEQFDADCHRPVDAYGDTGSATIDAYKAEPGGSLTGSFDIVFLPAGDKGKGTFNAPFCDAPYWLVGGCQ